MEELDRYINKHQGQVQDFWEKLFLLINLERERTCKQGGEGRERENIFF